MTQAIDRWLSALDQRLEKGARAYGDRSMLRPVREIEREFDEELLDQAGWLYVLWVQAARKADLQRPLSAPGVTQERTWRGEFLARMRHRLLRGDRGPLDPAPCCGAYAVVNDIEVLVLDAFEQREQITRRLFPIARALEVASWMAPPRGRRGGGGSEDGRDSG